MPSPRVSPVTLPKSVNTPTFPVGIEVVLHNKKSTTTATNAIRRNLPPAPRKFGIPGTEPPKSILPPVVFAIAPPSRHLYANSAAHATLYLPIFYYAGQGVPLSP